MPSGLPAGDSGGVVVLYTVRAPTTTTTIPVAHPGPPAVVHHSLPVTGAPVMLELVGSFSLLLAGTIAAVSARYGRRHPPADSVGRGQPAVRADPFFLFLAPAPPQRDQEQSQRQEE